VVPVRQSVGDFAAQFQATEYSRETVAVARIRLNG
jgi:hypothetical protein